MSCDTVIKTGSGEDMCHRCGEVCHRTQPCLMECMACALMLCAQCRPEAEHDCAGLAIEDAEGASDDEERGTSEAEESDDKEAAEAVVKLPALQNVEVPDFPECGAVRNGAVGTIHVVGPEVTTGCGLKITMTKYLPLYEWPEDPWPVCSRRGCSADRS